MTEPIDQATKVMSNTDGEDTQKVSLGELLLNAGTRIVDLEKQSNDQVEIITHLEKQLASLREQLERKSQLTEDKVMNTFIEVVEDRHFLEELGPGGNWKVKDGMQEEHSAIQDVKDLIDNLIEQLKQKEDENRELLDSISQLIYAMNTTGLPWNTDSTAEKAYANCRSLLKKHIG